MLETELEPFAIKSGRLVIIDPIKFKYEPFNYNYPIKGASVISARTGLWYTKINHVEIDNKYYISNVLTYTEEIDKDKEWKYLGNINIASGYIVLFDFAYLEAGYGIHRPDLLITRDDFDEFYKSCFLLNKANTFGKAFYNGVTTSGANVNGDYEIHAQVTKGQITAVKVTFIRKGFISKN